jgi:hypothetical protein
MKRLTVGSLLLALVSLGGCVVVPAGPPRVYASPVVVVPAPVIGVGVYGGYRR